MTTEGNKHNPLRAARKRLTRILVVLGVIGTLALGLLWVDSLEKVTLYANRDRSIAIFCSSVNYGPHPLLGLHGNYWRGSIEIYGLDNRYYFPRPKIGRVHISIPIYLIILAYLATLLLIWLVLMNRIARREFLRQSKVKSRETVA